MHKQNPQPFIDLRSDTVTLPTPAMLEAMKQAQLGDDVFMEDPSVNELQEYVADLFGMEDALFCSSGTQTNQIAIKVHTQPGDEVICDQLAHVYLYEGGGIAFNSGASVRLLRGERGMFHAQQVIEQINKEDVHFPVSKLVCVENTVNKGGGACWDWQELVKISEVCKNNSLFYHLDGARLFNALLAKDQNPKQYGQLFDTISICLSKGLGAPVGSLLLGSKQKIHKARRIRKIMGGGMRQAGMLAKAGLYAIQNNLDRLETDHRHAKMVEAVLVKQPWIKNILPVETNILIMELQENYPADQFVAYLNKHQIKTVSMGKNMVRFVFHLNHEEEHILHLCQILATVGQ